MLAAKNIMKRQLIYLFIISLFCLLLNICCSNNEYSKIIKSDQIRIIDKEYEFNRDKNQIELTIFIKNESKMDINGDIFFKLNFMRTKGKKLKIISELEKEFLKTDSLYKVKMDELSKPIKEDNIKKKKQFLLELKEKAEQIKNENKGSDSLSVMVVKSLEINSGGLAKVKIIQDLPLKFIGYKNIDYFESLEINSIRIQKE